MIKNSLNYFFKVGVIILGILFVFNGIFIVLSGSIGFFRYGFGLVISDVYLRVFIGFGFIASGLYVIVPEVLIWLGNNNDEE